MLDRETEKQHMQWAIESFQRTLEERPIGWYCRYGPSVNTHELVVEEGDFPSEGHRRALARGGRGYPKMMSIGLHPRLAGQSRRTSALREVIQHGLDKGGVWFARRNDIARWWLAHHEEFEHV